MELWDLAKSEKFCLAKESMQSLLLAYSCWTVCRHTELWLWGELNVIRIAVLRPPEAFT